MTNYKSILILTLSALSLGASARVIPGSPFNDGMVLQQESKALIWGKAHPGATVEVVASWDYKRITTTAAADSTWSLRIVTPKASFTPYAITLSDGSEPLVIRDVLVGEVWLASGQSNMEMPVQGWSCCPIDNSAQLIASAAAYSGKLHFCNIPNRSCRTPQHSVPAQWHNSNPQEILGFTAVGFYFAKALIDQLNVPVGIINDQWGGSNVEAWIPADILKSYGNVDLSDEAYKKMDQHAPAALYNAKIYPLRGYTIRGFIWYQGEANVGYHPETYARRLGDMVNRWRQDWGDKKLPFYFVEIAPYAYDKKVDGLKGAFLREQQHKAYHQIEYSGLVCTNDLVKPSETDQIHPANKQPVGQRLANWALRKQYGKTTIAICHPEYKSLKVKGDKAFLTFTHASEGFNREEGIQGFEICGGDSVFHTATAVVKNGKVVLRSVEVKQPVAVRYCFRNFLIGNLANKQGLPVLPFRTDNFPTSPAQHHPKSGKTTGAVKPASKSSDQFKQGRRLTLSAPSRTGLRHADKKA